MPDNRCIVIVGGGFAGTAAARALMGRLPAGVALTLISEESYTTFNPMLPEAVGASIFPEQVVAPLREVLMPDQRSRFVMGRVTQVDTNARRLRCHTLGGEREIGYDHLVLAFGNRARLDLLPGMAEHALPLKTVGDALEIRNVVLRRLARIELEDDPALRAALGHFVVIGGGFSGVEVAGELVDCLHSIRRFYPRVRPEELCVTVLHDGPRLLPELPQSLGMAALASLRRRGVGVHLGVRATRVNAHGVTLADDTLLAAHTVIATIGTQPNALVEAMGLATERGRVVVAADLSVPRHAGVWALGDCALVPNAFDGQSAPPTAQFAVREGRLLARNLLSVLQGRPTRAFAHKPLGSMAAIGHMKGVAQVFGLPLRGLPAWLMWRAYYLSQMPTLGRKVRIFVEWTWGMFFPADITHLRFPGSQAVQQQERDDAIAPSVADLRVRLDRQALLDRAASAAAR
jgi:NADH:ubiquinone reductase (H+-translocating)